MMVMVRVTEVIGNFNPDIVYMNDQNAMDFGTAVHVATELDDLGTLNESTVHNVLRKFKDMYHH